MEHARPLQAGVLARTREYVFRNFLYTSPDAPLDEGEPLLERGIIDSMGIVELVAFIENEFGIKVDDDEITEENLGTLARITSYVTSKQGAPVS